MRFHLEGLRAKQIRILREFGKEIDGRGFYLGGGSALSIYFGHRVSIDLDWFFATEMGDTLLLAESLRRAGLGITNVQTGPGTLHGSLHGVRVTFWEFRYPLLEPLTRLKEMGCALASPDDLACMKLSAIAQRGLRKDFCDLYVLGTNHRPLPELIHLYQRKFKVRDISPVLYGLSFFDDAESEPMPHLLLDVSWRVIKKTIQGWVQEFGKA